MKIGIVGAGALGTLLGFSLARDHDVRVLVRDAKTARAIANRGGLALEGSAPRYAIATHEHDAFGDIDLLIVAVKSYATVDALAPLRARIAHDATVLSVQNGLDAAEQIEFALGHRHAVAAGPTTEGVTALEPGFARHTASGMTTLGWFTGHAAPRTKLDELAATLNASGLAAQAVDDSAPFIWAKLVANAAINPVTAIARVTNGEVLERPDLRERSAAIAREVAAVAAHAGVVLPFSDPVARIFELARQTAANRSSMLQDVERGRPTEIEAIVGAVVRRAASAGIAVPATAAAYDEVRRLTNA